MNDEITVAADLVEAGAQWLDEHGPIAWWKLVDLDQFDMTSPCKCVLGWAYGDGEGMDDGLHNGYGKAVVAEFGTTEDDNDLSEPAWSWVREHGFEHGSASYADLQSEWRRVINERIGES